jgi:hypothetical protein
MTAGFNQSDGLVVGGFPRMRRRGRSRYFEIMDNGVRNDIQILQTNDALISHASKQTCEIVGEIAKRKS